MADNDIELPEGNSFLVKHILTNPEESPIYVNDATVTVTINDSAGDPIAGESWPVTLDYVALSNGIYQKTFVPNAAIIAKNVYEIVINATGVSGLIGEWKNKVRAVERKG